MLYSIPKNAVLCLLLLLCHFTIKAACNGKYHEEIISFTVPASAKFGSITITVSSVQVNSISGLPKGMSYECISCNTSGGGTLSIRVFGTPNDVPGDYNLQIAAQAVIGGGANISISLPDPSFPESYFTITVENCNNTGGGSGGGGTGGGGGSGGGGDTPTCTLKASASAVDASCNGINNGAAVVSFTGAGNNVNVFWSTGATTQIISGLAPGSYSVTVTDGLGCSASTSVTVNQANGPSISVLYATLTGLQNGEIAVRASGGQSPYTFVWSNGRRGDVISFLSAGEYEVTVTDKNGCSSSEVITLQPAVVNCALDLNFTVSDISCNGRNDGAASVKVSGDNGGYQVLWSNGATKETINSLRAGDYTVTITDFLGCTNVDIITIKEPLPLTVNTVFSTISTPQNGEILVNATGGKPDYQYLWSNGFTGNYISGLAAGTYTVTVTDKNGCTATKNHNLVLQECPLKLEINKTDVTCFGFNNGSATAIVSGTTGSVELLWSNGFTGATIQNLTAGTYSVTATDANGCTVNQSFEITSPSEIQVQDTIIQGLICESKANASIELVMQGGTAPYFFFWSNGATGSKITNLSAGSYQVSIGDSRGCTTIEDYTIENNITAMICDSIVATFIGEENVLRYRFSLPDTTLNGRWIAESNLLDTLVIMGNRSTVEYTFPKEGGYKISYIYLTADSCEVKCQKEMELSFDAKEEGCSFLTAKYVGMWGALRYEFSVGDTMLTGRWTAVGTKDETLIRMGARNTVAYTFSQEDTYKICYNYRDANDTPVECCRDIFLSLPTGNRIGNDIDNQQNVTLSNQPNPFSDFTNLQFTLPVSTKGKIEIWDINGKLLYQQQQVFESGLNQIMITQQFANGIYFARFTSAIWTGETKLIVIAN